ncbi:unnamed protein product, partial [Polarella glacialis]
MPVLEALRTRFEALDVGLMMQRPSSLALEGFQTGDIAAATTATATTTIVAATIATETTTAATATVTTAATTTMAAATTIAATAMTTATATTATAIPTTTIVAAAPSSASAAPWQSLEDPIEAMEDAPTPASGFIFPRRAPCHLHMAATLSRLSVDSVEVLFPFAEILEPQRMVIMSTVRACLQGKHVLLESPTGTGKTMALLCAALAAQRHFALTTGCAPRVIFCTRTHQQVKQVVKEARRSPYRPWLQIVGSREQGLCTEPSVLQAARDDDTKSSQVCRGARRLAERPRSSVIGADGRAPPAAGADGSPVCNQWTSLADPSVVTAAHREMRNHNNNSNSNNNSNNNNQHAMLDVEDLGDLGRRLGACPYFLSRAALPNAELVICPYNYVLEPSIASTTGLLEDSCIVIIDEGHNLEDTCCEAGSAYISSSALTEIENRIDQALIYLNDFHSEEEGVDSQTILVLRDSVRRLKQLCLDTLHAFLEANEGQLHEDRISCKTWNSTLESPPTIADFLTRSGLPESFAGAVKALQETLQQRGQGGAPRLAGLASQVMKALGELESLANTLVLCRERPTQYKIHLEAVRDLRSSSQLDPISSQGFPIRSSQGLPFRSSQGRSVNSQSVNTQGRSVGSSQGWSVELSILLVHPEAVFQSLATAAHCVVIASGTLAPTASFAAELGSAFAERLLCPPVEAPNVIDSSQLGVAFVGTSRRGIELRCVRDRLQQDDFLCELGRTVLEIVAAIPGGVLVFLPSRPTLEAAVQEWRKPGSNRSPSLWDRLASHKGLLAIEGGGPDAAQALARHEAASSREGGAVLFCVYRGRSSEGMSLSDDAVRGVVCVGIPLPPLKPAVRLKRDYNDAVAALSVSGGRRGLDGDSWCHLGAHRAVNQALGRAVRHRHDYGAIVLVDARWTVQGSLRAVKYLPLWLRQLMGLASSARGEHLACPVGQLIGQLKRHFVPADAGQEMQVTCDGPCGNLSAHLAVTCQGTSGAAAQVPGESTRTMAVAAVEVAGAPSFATLLLDASSLRPGRYYQLCVDHGLGQTGASGQQIYVASVTGAMPKMIRADVGQALAFDCEVCSTRPDDSHVRLADGTALSGRLEIFHDGAWGSVCGRNFTDVEASVVCHQLGLVGGESLGASSASGSGPIWMSGVGCKGSETGLGQCSHAGWDVHNCSHTEDVAVLCSHTVDSPKMCCTSKSQVFLALASGPSCADAAVNSEAGGHARSDFVMMQGAGTAWTVSLEAGALSVGSYYSLCIDGDGSFGPLDPGAVDLIYITPLSQLGTVAIMKRTFQRMLIHCDSSCTTSTEVFLATHCDNSSAPALEQTAAAQLLGSGELWEATVDASSLTLGQTYRVCLDRDGASKSAFPVGDSGLLAYVSNVDSAPVALASKLQSATLTCEGCSSATEVYLTSGVCDGTVIPAVPWASLGAAGGSEWTVLLDGRSIKTGKHYRLCVDLDGENGTLLGGPSRFEVGGLFLSVYTGDPADYSCLGADSLVGLVPQPVLCMPSRLGRCTGQGFVGFRAGPLNTAQLISLLKRLGVTQGSTQVFLNQLTFSPDDELSLLGFPPLEVDRPAGMAHAHEVTGLMKERQESRPEQWTMSAQHWFDIIEFCKTSPRYAALKTSKPIVNMYDINSLFVKPWSKDTGCSLAVLMSRESVQNAQLMISHCWGEDLEQTEEALCRHFDVCRVPLTTAIWFCVFSNYQAEDDAGPSLSDQLAMEPFARVIGSYALKTRNGGYGMVAVHTASADLYSRLWCVHEVERAISQEDVLLTASLSEQYVRGVTDRVDIFVERGCSAKDCLEAADIQVSTIKARCGNLSDEKMLVEQILKQEGGFRQLDAVVTCFRKEQLPTQVFLALVGRTDLHLGDASKAAQADYGVVCAAVQRRGLDTLKFAAEEVKHEVRLTYVLCLMLGMPFGAQSAADRTAAIKQLTSLTILDVNLQAKNLGEDAGKALTECVEQLSDLSSLCVDLSQNSLAEEGGKALAESLAQLRNLTGLSLDMCHNSLCCNVGKAIAAALATLNLLTSLTLNLNDNSMADDGGRAIGQSLAQLMQITDLTLSFAYNSLGDASCRATAEGMSQLKQLSSLALDLSKNSICNDGISALTGAVSQLTLLTKLDLNLSRNTLGEGGTTTTTPTTTTATSVIAECVAQLTQLKMLTNFTFNIAYISLGDDGARAFAQALAQLTQLTNLTLILRYNGLGNDAGKAIGEGVGELWQLTSLKLDLYNNSLLGADGATALVAGLGQLKQLACLSLDLSNNDLGEAGGAAIGDGVAQLTQLSSLTLDVYNATLGDAGGKAVAEGVAWLTQLDSLTLNLAFNDLGDLSCQAVA